MQTNLAAFIRDTAAGREADAILRACVHCGFCTATCPTYQLLGDELDGPRGRIYLIKQMLEGGPVTAKTLTHLDRCLTCRSCESTCPSGVRYGHLVDIGRHIAEERVGRPAQAKFFRFVLREMVTRPWIFVPVMAVGRLLRPILPASLAAKVTPASPARPWPVTKRERTMITLAGCVQPTLAPDINAAAARVFDALGITLVEAEKAGCCGAVRFHLNDQEAARDDMRRNIDAWIPLLDAGAEAIVMTASGCGVQVKDYGHALADDPDYAARAARVSLLTRDVSEAVLAEKDNLLPLLAARAPAQKTRLAFHSPCTLQHGQKIRGTVEQLLEAAGYELTDVADSHLCCGSAGTYSLTQPEISERLRENKVAALSAGAPRVIATANIGCLTHIQGGTELPVRHWIELVADRLQA